ncbi:dirigent protein 24 [Quercus suber]|uniref:Dirigent protein n=1 Tax=Quercus suber TaxID=58331 RepID=A0AAW0KJU4_QUESU
MAKLSILTTKTLKASMYLLYLAITLGCANSARILDEVDTQPPILPNPAQLSNSATTTIPNVTPTVGPTTTLPSGQIPTATTTTTPATVVDDTDSPLPESETPDSNTTPVTPVVSPTVDPVADTPQPEPDTPDVDTTPVAPIVNPVAQPNVQVPNTIPTPVAGVAPVVSPTVDPVADTPQSEPETPDVDTTLVAPIVNPVAQPNVQVPNTIPTPITGVAPVTSPTTTTSPTGPTPVTTATSATPGPQIPPLTFFMHDVLGGTHPSARVVTGIIANTQINGLPFSKPNDNIFPVSGGVPLTNQDLNGLINNDNNNLPFLAGLNGIGPQSSTTFQNSGNNVVTNGGNSQPFVTAGQLPSGASLQKLMFGSLTVFDDELTEGHELGSAVVGKAQGFYLASSLDGTSQTIAVTLLLSHGGGQQHHDQTVVEDAISFFGVHRTASHESQIAVVGGTGKYENAKGYATLGSLHQEDQHTTDGVDTVLEFSVYLSY